jgi:hypothetical protein
MTTSLPTIATRTAHWGWTDHRYFGLWAFGELAGNESFTGLTALAITGRRVSTEARAVLDDIAAVMTLADPRIWPLKITRLVASYGGTTPAVAAGMVLLEGAKIGPWSCTEAATMLVEFRERLAGVIDGERPNTGGDEQAGAVRREIDAYRAAHGFVWGFGTPYRGEDERVVALRDCLRRRGDRDKLPHWRVMELLAAGMKGARNVAPNIGVGVAAACLDLGLAPKEIGPLATALLQHAFFANAVEGARQAPEQLRHLPDACVSYAGRPPRESPRAAAKDRGSASENTP